MGQPSPHSPVLFVMAAFSRYPQALDWARRRAEEHHGPVGLTSEAFAFDETDYYEPTMGAALRKQFFAFERLIDPAELVAIKRQTNTWETDYKAESDHAEPRPLNLDPGYVSLGKLVLASTKDHAHRLYLADGIYAEITLHYQNKAWRHHNKTFKDYRRADYQAFFTKCRDYLKSQRET